MVKMDDGFSPALAAVKAGDLCAGCGACAGRLPDALHMAEGGGGFPRPHATRALTAAEDADFKTYCPGYGQDRAQGDAPDDPLWGPFVNMYSGWATDPDLRHRAASGGALSAVLVYLLQSGMVDAVWQTAAAIDPPQANRAVVSTDAAEVLAAAGSRYAPSSPLAGLPKALASGMRYAFVGKPCDAAALRALASRDAKIAACFPVILSFFCAGVPSAAGGRALLAAMGADPAQVTGFRYRGMGWPGKAVATLADGSTREMTYHDSWGLILSRHVQNRCKICADGTGGAADLAFGDAWQADAAGYPVFDDAAGQSLIVTRTPLGTEILAKAQDAGHLAHHPFDPAALAALQPGQTKRRRELLVRLAALRLLGRPVPRYRGMQLWAAARQAPPRQWLRAFARTLRRSLISER